MNLSPTEARQLNMPRLTRAEDEALKAIVNVNVTCLFDLVSKTKPWTDEERASVYKLLEATHALVMERGPRWRVCKFERLEWLQGPNGERVYLNHDSTSSAVGRDHLDRVVELCNKADPCS